VRVLTVSVVVPVKDEVDSIPQLVEEITTELSKVQLDGAELKAWELILVDDGSTDGSWPQMLRASQAFPDVRALRLRRNLGKSAALAAGISTAQHDVIITMDGDLQDDPTEIQALLQRLANGADLVSGYKAQRLDPLSKRLPSKLYNSATSAVTGLKLNDHNCGLKAGWRQIFLGMPLYGELHRYTASLAHADGYRVEEMEVHHRARVHGQSKFGLERYARGAIDLLTVLTLTRYGRRPAHLFGGAGLLAGAVSVIALTYLFFEWLFSADPIGDRPLLIIAVMAGIMAVQMLSFGLLAEMLVHRRLTDDRPLANVAEASGLGQTTDLSRAKGLGDGHPGQAGPTAGDS
jgi:glycosyltransferase involved in cell wall biosynthesis